MRLSHMRACGGKRGAEDSVECKEQRLIIINRFRKSTDKKTNQRQKSGQNPLPLRGC